jgi:hypothetical protein
MHKEEKHNHRHHNYHHHNHKHKKRLDDHNHLHAMIGIVDNPAGFALYSNPIHQKHNEPYTSSQDELFSRVPTVTLSNNRLLPQVGFGVSGQHIEHKDIPLMVLYQDYCSMHRVKI